MKLTVIATLMIVSGAVCGSGTASAQQPRAGYPAVFGGAAVDPDAHQSLDLMVDVAEAYDQNLLAEAGGISAPASPYQFSGFYTAVEPQLKFASRGDRLQFSLNAGSNVRYYQQLDKVFATNHSVGAGFVAQLTNSTSLSVNEAAAYSPAYLFGLLAPSAAPAIGDVVPGGADYRTTSQRSYSSATNAGLTHTIGRRASLSFTGNFGHTAFVDQVPGQFDMTAYDAGGRWTYSLNRDMKLRLGYTYHRSQYAEGLVPTEHDVELGIDYVRPLSPTRSWTLGLSVGPTLVTGTFPGAGFEDASARYRLLGDAFLQRQIGRSWSARAGYHRGLTYVAGLAGPAYTDAANAEAQGFLNRRIDLLFSTAYAQGTLAAGTAPGNFTTYSGSARLRVALTSEWAAYFEGLYYDYAFDQNLLLPGLPPQFTRSGGRAGLTWWLPMRSR